jgi:endoglucanase
VDVDPTHFVMLSPRRFALLMVAGLASFGAPGAARAAQQDPGGFRLQSKALFVHERDGAAVITIERSDTSREAQIRYIALPMSAAKVQDFTPVKAMIDFQSGQSSATFRVPIVDHGISGLPRTVKIALFGPSPIGLASPSTGVLTILNDDPRTAARDPLNPLGLPTPPPRSDPLTGARPFIDRSWGLASLQAGRWRSSHPRWAHMLDVIAAQPEVHRFGNWSGPNPGIQVAQYLERAASEQPGSVPEFATYYLVNGHCGQYSDPSWRQGAYHKWIQSLAGGIGEYRAVVFLEMDSLITAGCLSKHGVQVRMHELHDAIDILSKLPRVVVYLDAGAGDAAPAAKTARLLRSAGIWEIQGFFVNSTHFDWSSREIRYGRAISRLTGGKHFVVSTSVNGRGPLVPHDRVRQGNEVLCNPPGRGLGPKPTFTTGYRNVDAFAWIGNPGKSGGACRPGAPPTGAFWPQLALTLVRNADFRVR